MLQTESEMAGIFIGDGHSVCQKIKNRHSLKKGMVITGDINESAFFDHIRTLSLKLFDLRGCIQIVHDKKRDTRCRRFSVFSNRVYQWLDSRQLLKKDKVPNWIDQISFIRGVFDTDGCVYRHKDGHYELYFKGKQHWLISWIHKKLSDLNIKVGKLRSANDGQIRFSICGFDNVHLFFNKISPANEKHYFRLVC